MTFDEKLMLWLALLKSKHAVEQLEQLSIEVAYENYLGAVGVYGEFTPG